MKERSLIERVVAILGVLIGTVVWVVRLLISVLRDVMGKVTQSGSGAPSADSDGGAGIAGSAKSFAADLRTRGESLVDDVAAKGQAVVDETREKVEGLIHREGTGDDAQSSGEEHSQSGTAFAPVDTGIPGLSSTQHKGIGGIPEASRLEDTTESGRNEDDEEYSEHPWILADDEVDIEERGFTRGIPNLEEPGGDVVSRGDGEPVTGYAGQVMSEGDVGLDRGNDDTGLAEGEAIHSESRYDSIWVKDHLGVGIDDDEVDEDDDLASGETGGIPAASRGWEEPTNDPLADEESSWRTGEIDIANDEADEVSSAGMHIIESPDEPFIDDDAAAQSLGFTEPGSAPPFDTMTVAGDDTVVDDDMFAADALGNRLGGDAASGDLGPAQSADDATWDPGESAPPSDIQGAYDGSGVDTFASDDIAEDMLQSVEGSGDEESTANEGSDPDTSSIAWASASGVIDEDLNRPTALSDDQDAGMSAGDAEAMTDADDAPGEPGSGREVYDDFSVHGSPSDAVRAPIYNPDDAGLLDVAAEAAQSLGEEEGATAVSGDDTDARVGTDLATGTDSGADVGHSAGSGTGSGTDAVLGTAGVSGTAATKGGGRRAGNAPAGAVRGDGSGVCPADYPIKGNANSHIYHRPTDSSYDSTIPEFCFATEDDAKAAGFRPRKG